MRLCFCFLMFLILLQCKQSETNQYQTNYGEVFGSTYFIKYQSSRNFQGKIDSIFNAFNNAVSTYQRKTEIERFNQSDSGLISKNKNFIEMILFSKRMYEKCNGYFDPTIAPLSNLWGFGENRLKKEPSKEEIDSVLNFTGLEKILIQDSLIKKTHPNISLNFNSITGYCNDIIVKLFDANGIENYLIEIGGEVSVSGFNDKGKTWTVGIDDPMAAEQGNRKLNAIIALENTSLATSGNYRKFFIDNSGNKIVHTINPKTGKAKASNILSATIIHPSCAEADAIATAIMAMGTVNAIDFLANNKNIPAYLIISDNNIIQTKTYNGFGNTLK